MVRRREKLDAFNFVVPEEKVALPLVRPRVLVVQPHVAKRDFGIFPLGAFKLSLGGEAVQIALFWEDARLKECFLLEQYVCVAPRLLAGRAAGRAIGNRELACKALAGIATILVELVAPPERRQRFVALFEVLSRLQIGKFVRFQPKPVEREHLVVGMQEILPLPQVLRSVRIFGVPYDVVQGQQAVPRERRHLEVIEVLAKAAVLVLQEVGVLQRGLGVGVDVELRRLGQDSQVLRDPVLADERVHGPSDAAIVFAIEELNGIVQRGDNTFRRVRNALQLVLDFLGLRHVGCVPATEVRVCQVNFPPELIVLGSSSLHLGQVQAREHDLAARLEVGAQPLQQHIVQPNGQRQLFERIKTFLDDVIERVQLNTVQQLTRLFDAGVLACRQVLWVAVLQVCAQLALVGGTVHFQGVVSFAAAGGFLHFLGAKCEDAPSTRT
mmetsp:Transcript_52430/g.131831  ORF Transcript_52430/g.131831 Transcript_52430/m.131831 type:complete len:440 (-) Transcript_52430:140-1459(-)